MTITLVDLLRIRASETGGREAFCFIREDGKVDASITYGELHQRAMAIAGELQTLMAQGDRALLLFPPGLDFIAAFFGCLYAGVAAVPVAVPGRNRSTSSVEAILRACKPAVILSTTDQCESSKQHFARLPALLERPWIATDRVADDRQQAARTAAGGPAHRLPSIHLGIDFLAQRRDAEPRESALQRRRHSTGLRQHSARPGRLLAAALSRHGTDWRDCAADLLRCAAAALLAPVAFLQRPALWLETISKTQANVSGGPDFAYDLCVRKISAEERDGLDLSSWKVAFTGAERIRASTIERFVEAFGPCGFRREAFFPCYGLAEATLMVSGGPGKPRPPSFASPPTPSRTIKFRTPPATVPPRGPSSAAARGCPGSTISIVDPEMRQRCADGTVGEICVQGPSVAKGYYEQAEATQAAFGGRLSTGEGPLLRTGDLGFSRQGQLFVTGRLKDVIIIRGRNYYPEDIEHFARRCASGFPCGPLRRVLHRGRGPGATGHRPGSRAAATRSGRRGGPGDRSPGRCRAARTGSLCDRAGQGGRDSQDIQRKEAAFGVPRALFSMTTGDRRPVEGGHRCQGRRTPRGAGRSTAAGVRRRDRGLVDRVDCARLKVPPCRSASRRLFLTGLGSVTGRNGGGIGAPGGAAIVADGRL